METMGGRVFGYRFQALGLAGLRASLFGRAFAWALASAGLRV